jgi:hypothetical protein
MRRTSLVLILLSSGLGTAAVAAPAAKAATTAHKAATATATHKAGPRIIKTVMVPEPPLVPVGTTIAKPIGLMVPQQIILRPMTPAETEANAIWTMRAGLNVAALQCQFSPFLATVRNYNDVLKQHSAELAKAQTTMQAHFKRYDKAKGLNSFDQYTTKTYNSFSTLDAQYSFCETASFVGRAALVLSKGNFGSFAMQRNAELRAALTPPPVPTTLGVHASPQVLPPIDG